MGIEPTCEAWKASVLPLNYTRTESNSSGNAVLVNRGPFAPNRHPGPPDCHNVVRPGTAVSRFHGRANFRAGLDQRLAEG